MDELEDLHTDRANIFFNVFTTMGAEGVLGIP